MALKREDVIRVTKELVAEYGEDYVYQREIEEAGCKYGPTATADGCIVGLIAKRLDQEIYDRLVRWDEGFNGEYIPPWGRLNSSGELPGIIEAEGDDRALLLAMQLAQGNQDTGVPWGRAVEPILALEKR